jgi:hypothetical protein
MNKQSDVHMEEMSLPPVVREWIDDHLNWIEQATGVIVQDLLFTYEPQFDIRHIAAFWEWGFALVNNVNYSEKNEHCSIYPLLGRVLNISFHPQGAKDLKSGGLAVNLCLVPQRHVLFTASESTRHHLQYLIRRYVVQHCNASIPPTMSQSAADDDDW